MFAYLQKLSLRTRLFGLTAFALSALLIALLSAFRTAQMSAIFAERQAEIGVNAALRELLGENRDFPNGRNEAENPSGKGIKKPPHIHQSVENYKDAFTRSTAIALHRFGDYSGGFCTTGGEIKGAIFNQTFSADEMRFVENACLQIAKNQTFDAQRLEFIDSVLFLAADEFETANGEIEGAFAARRVVKTNLFADRFNLLTQGFLLFSVIGLLAFSLLTLRDWRRGMLKIESGLNEITADLSARIDAPKLAELNKISLSINGLAENLETNLQRQKELESDLLRNEKLAALGRVASGVAHEVRNPLASMKLKIQLAERANFAPEKLEKTFAVLREEIERLDNLVKKLLDVSRPTKLNFEQISLVTLIEKRLSLIAEKAEAQNVVIEFEPPRRKPAREQGRKQLYFEINADGEKLAQVFDNLFLNALEAMPHGGKLRVEIAEKEKIVEIKISDTGAGISAETKARLFEPFFTTKDKGTGLGLAISREIIEAHHGKLFLGTSEKGATFVIELMKES